MNRFRLRWLAIYLAAAIAGAVIGWTLTPTRAQPTAILPVTTVTSVTTGAVATIAPYNPSRRSFTICTATNPIWFATVNPSTMAQVTPAVNTGILIAAGTCFNPPSVITASGSSGGMGAQIQAIAQTGTAIVTVLEY